MAKRHLSLIRRADGYCWPAACMSWDGGRCCGINDDGADSGRIGRVRAEPQSGQRHPRRRSSNRPAIVVSVRPGVRARQHEGVAEVLSAGGAAGRDLAEQGVRRAGYLRIDRDAPSQRMEGGDHVRGALAAGESMFVFPEGRFVRAPGLLPFRLGASGRRPRPPAGAGGPDRHAAAVPGPTPCCRAPAASGSWWRRRRRAIVPRSRPARSAQRGRRPRADGRGRCRTTPASASACPS